GRSGGWGSKWHPYGMASPTDVFAAGHEMITLPDAAELLALPITKVHQLIKDGKLVVTRDDQGRRVLPRIFIDRDGPLKGLPGVITLLRDGGYTDDEIIGWLLRPDDT